MGLTFATRNTQASGSLRVTLDSYPTIGRSSTRGRIRAGLVLHVRYAIRPDLLFPIAVGKPLRFAARVLVIRRLSRWWPFSSRACVSTFAWPVRCPHRLYDLRCLWCVACRSCGLSARSNITVFLLAVPYSIIWQCACCCALPSPKFEGVGIPTVRPVVSRPHNTILSSSCRTVPVGNTAVRTSFIHHQYRVAKF